MFDVKEIGIRMKQRREQLELTLEEVSKSVGVAKTTISRYENGEIARPKIPVLHSIANALDVRPEWLFGKSDQMEDEDRWDWDSSYLKELRENSGLSPAETAFRLGIPSSRYIAIESSAVRPTVPVLVSLSQIFNTSVDVLLGLTFDNNTNISAGYTHEDTEMIARYHRASQEAKRIVDLALAPYEESASPTSRTGSAG